MRKNELIELLKKVPGNPEVVLWNGYVDDYLQIDREIVETTLVKYTRKFLGRRRDPGTPAPSDEEIEKAFKAQGWDFPNEFVVGEQFKEWYGKHQKKIYVLNGKRRGKDYWDRLGTMSY